MPAYFIQPIKSNRFTVQTFARQEKRYFQITPILNAFNHQGANHAEGRCASLDLPDEHLSVRRESQFRPGLIVDSQDFHSRLDQFPCVPGILDRLEFNGDLSSNLWTI